MLAYTANVIEKGRLEGILEGEAQFKELMKRLLEAGRNEDALRAASDEEAREVFYKEFGINHKISK